MAFPHCCAAHGASGGPRAPPEITGLKRKRLVLVAAAMRASGPAAAARPVEAGLGPARDGWPPTSALALLVKMAAVAIAERAVQSLSAQASVVCRCRILHTRAPRDPRRSARA